MRGRQFRVWYPNQPVVDAAEPGGLAEDVQDLERIVVEARGPASVDLHARPRFNPFRAREMLALLRTVTCSGSWYAAVPAREIGRVGFPSDMRRA